ncbi:IS4 family transposase [Aliikangiella sp. IMCC44359]
MEASVELAGSTPSKMIHIGDRENDIYEYYCRCRELDTFFISRVCVNRLADESTLVEEIGSQKVYAKQAIEFVDKNGKLVSTTLALRVKAVELHPPIGKEAHYPDIRVTFISAIETDTPEDREPIRWSFITNLPVKSKKDIKQVLDWYKQRWKIETYFKVIKSGFKVEESKLRTADRLSRLISMCCILAWRIHWLTFLNRETERINPEVAFDEIELKIMKSYFSTQSLNTLQDFTAQLAVLGGYLNRKNDPPPGNTIIWRGLIQLHELKRGFLLANICG